MRKRLQQAKLLVLPREKVLRKGTVALLSDVSVQDQLEMQPEEARDHRASIRLDRVISSVATCNIIFSKKSFKII